MTTLYIAASYRHLHAVRLLAAHITDLCPGVRILDWTEQATPPAGLTAAKRRAWMDTDHGNETFDFCRSAASCADMVVYFGESGQDAGVEIGMASAGGAVILGLAGTLESPGLMLHGAVQQWAASVPELLALICGHVRCKADLSVLPDCNLCPAAEKCRGRAVEVV